MRSYIAILVVALVLFSVGAFAQQQVAQAPTPEQALGVLSQAAAAFKGTLQDHMMIQECEQTIAAALKIYRQYVPEVMTKP